VPEQAVEGGRGEVRVLGGEDLAQQQRRIARLTALFAVRHREAPERLRGQIFTTGVSLKITGFAVGAAIAGPIGVGSLPGALLIAAGFQLPAVVAFAAIRPSYG
jgi:hypothetical protein